ncbi:MAG: hypothetical protein JWO00_48 [Candidatus Parcubacteria bacterium]|nr:hypothetical protein [Candidatus Parcubacteria bacterium]
MHLIYTYFAFESLQEFFLSIFELFRWVHRAYDEGFVVMAIDSETLAHRSLEVKELFPHFVHGVTYNEKIARIEKALDHYNWSLKQVRDGARVGAAKEFGFEYAPAFKYAKPVTVPSES